MQIKLNPDQMKHVHVEKLQGATVDEALNYTGFGKYNLGLLLVCSWALQAMGLDLFGTSFTVGAAVCDLKLDMMERSLLTATPLIGVVVGAQIWGYVSDTRGRKLTLVLSMCVGWVLASLSSLAPDWTTMALLKFLSSIFTSATNSGAYTLLGESCAGATRGRTMLLCTSALVCSQAVGAVFAYPILPLKFSYWIDILNISFRPWRLLALVLAMPCGISAFLLQFFHESPKFLASVGRYDEALEVLQKIYSTNTGRNPESFPIKKLLVDHEEDTSFNDGSTFYGAILKQTGLLFKPPHLKRTLQLFYIVIVIYTTGSGFIMWLPYIMNNLFTVMQQTGGSCMNLCAVISLSSETAFIVSNNITTEVLPECDDTIQESALFSTMAYGSLVMFANIVLSFTSGSRKRLAMLCVLTVSAMSAIMINLITIPLAGGIFYFLLMMCALSMGILSVYFIELYPTSLRGTVSCMSVMVGRLFAFFGVNAIGVLLSTNCEATFYAWSLFICSAIVVTWLLPKDKMK